MWKSKWKLFTMLISKVGFNYMHAIKKFQKCGLISIDINVLCTIPYCKCTNKQQVHYWKQDTRCRIDIVDSCMVTWSRLTGRDVIALWCWGRNILVGTDWDNVKLFSFAFTTVVPYLKYIERSAVLVEPTSIMQTIFQINLSKHDFAIYASSDQEGDN